MRTSVVMLSALCAVFVPTAPAQSVPLQTMSGLLRLVQTSPLPTEGYMDHMAVDVKGQRLFISGEAGNSLVGVDLRSGKVIHVRKGLAYPRKPFYIPETDEIWVDLG